MATELPLRKVIMGFLGILVVGLAIYIAFISVRPYTSKGFLDIQTTNQTAEGVETKNINFYTDLVKNYKECKLSPDTNCFCPLLFQGAPENYIISITNIPGSKITTITMTENAKMEDCGDISSTGELKTNTSEIEKDAIYFEDYYLSPDTTIIEILNNDGTRSTYTGLKKESFASVNELHLYGSKMCSTKDVSGSDEIEFKNGAIYKFNQEDTAIFSYNSNIIREQSGDIASEQTKGLRKCTPAKNALLAYEEFKKLVSQIKECKDSTCTYFIKQNSKTAFPQDYTVTAVNQKIILEYKGQEVRSEQISKEFCLFNDFKKTTLDQAVKLTSLNFNNYLVIEFYPFDNNLCLLPYTIKTLADKKAFAESSKIKKPIVPE
ncbi:hypothetical protein HYU23_03595 [Candidatus Woesearchaeota archaeon]|nr:hypothetical protein [Candidatus Woesearchaeota archaeon]